MAEKYSIIWASVICGAHNFLCLLPLWDRALQRWRMSSWYFSATLTMGTMTMLVTAPQLHRQWGHRGTILGYHSKFLVLKTATCDYTKVDGDLCLSNRVSQNNALLWFFHPGAKKAMKRCPLQLVQQSPNYCSTLPKALQTRVWSALTKWKIWQIMQPILKPSNLFNITQAILTLQIQWSKILGISRNISMLVC